MEVLSDICRNREKRPHKWALLPIQSINTQAV